MRIIAGKHKGRKLFYQTRRGLRPTTARVKEALFNILGPAVSGAAFLDLFAGGGGVGIEAISRGASMPTFVEKERRNCRLIQRNLELLHESSKVYNCSYDEAIPALAAKRKAFAYVYLDPGYQTDLAKNCLQALAQSSIINEITLIIAEHSSREVLPARVDCLTVTRRETYGDSGVTFYRLKQAVR